MLSGIFLLLFGLGFAFKSIALLFIFTPLFILINVQEIPGHQKGQHDPPEQNQL